MATTFIRSCAPTCHRENGAVECLVCGCRISFDISLQQPICATIWHSTGGSMSDVVDMTTGDRRLEAYVCDACTKRQNRRIFTVVPGPTRDGNRRYPGIVDDPE